MIQQDITPKMIKQADLDLSEILNPKKVRFCKCKIDRINFDEVVFLKGDTFLCDTCEEPINYNKFGKLQRMNNS